MPFSLADSSGLDAGWTWRKLSRATQQASNVWFPHISLGQEGEKGADGALLLCGPVNGGHCPD